MIKPHVADVLERCATELQSVAFDFREDARGHDAAERRIGEVERICGNIRAAVRGRG